MNIRIETYNDRVIVLHLKDVYKPLVDVLSEFKLDGFVMDNKPSTSKATKTDAILTLSEADIETISRKLLCFLTAPRILKTWSGIKQAMSRKIGFLSTLSGKMVPECVYRGGMCPFINDKCNHYQQGAIEAELRDYLKSFVYDERVINIKKH